MEPNVVERHHVALQVPLRRELPGDVALDDRDVQPWPGRRRQWDDREGRRSRERHRNQGGRRSRLRACSTERAQEEPVHEHDHECRPPHAGHGGERQEEAVPVLRVPEASPREPAERPGAPGPVQGGPEGGCGQRRSNGAIVSPEPGQEHPE